MKTLFTLVLSILSAALFAQLNIGDIYLGGGICLETESVSSTFGGSTTDGPSTNYFSLSTYGQLAITNNITVGGGLGFESESGSSTDEFSTGDFSSNLFMAKGAARHWTTCGGPDSPVKPFVQAEIAAGFGKSESSFESGGENFTSTDDLFNFRAGLRAGIYYDLNKHWGLTLSTGRIGYWSEKQSQSDFSVKTSGFDFKAGLKRPELSLVYLIRPNLVSDPN